MAYKQKPKSIQIGTSSYRKALNLADIRKNLMLNKSMDNSSLKDGRAKSSPFQRVTKADADAAAKANKKTKTTKKVTTERGEHEGMKGWWQHTDTTTDSSGVGSAEYNEAFRKAREQGLSTFTWKGNQYTTELGGSSTDRQSEFRPDLEPIQPIGSKEVPNIDTEMDAGPIKTDSCYCIDANTKQKVPMGCPPKYFRRFKEGRVKEHRVTGEDMLPQCKKDSKITDLCNGMTRAEVKAEREKCKKMGTMLSRAVKERWYFNSKTCRCESKKSGGKEVVQNIGETTKDVFKCMRNGFMSKNGKPTKIPCAAYGSGPKGGGRTM